MSLLDFKKFDLFKKREKKKPEFSVATLKNQEKIPLKELFPDRFINDNTRYRTFYDFLVASKFDWKKQEEIDLTALDLFVKKKTKFPTWEAMKKKATAEYYSRKLGF
ncbi:MAG: hypothetical protein LBV67_09830 [Streptococcaceae bacterium]|jgi:hypothetical protein|nr:hypothetical protein [Streptococcaceae bacterium]